MTRKKQGTPQKLNNFEKTNSGNVLTDCKENLARHAVVDSDTSCNLVQNGVDHIEFEKKSCNQNTMDTSCKKLVEFTTTFLLDSNLNSCANRKDFDETKDYIGDAVKLTWKNSAKQGIKRPPGSPTISPSPSKQQCDDQCNQNFDSTEPDHAISAARNANKTQTPPRSGHSSPNTNTSPNIDDPRFCDLASLTNAQKLLMDAMLRQKQLYDQCSNNWVNVQRNDNNCLSKSKAERYRWCVNGNDKQPTSTSHVTNLKRSATMAGIGTSPIQDKLYSTVFTGASKFHCRDCGDPFSTLVDLTVHMNKTGHFRDTNNPPSKLDEKSLEPRTKRRSLIEDESKAPTRSLASTETRLTCQPSRSRQL
uniref:C2H2-type domain-containing protein n=1 Tax=Ciona savignyi TaxID=51511 RepID=H2Y9W4_CIOSA